MELGSDRRKRRKLKAEVIAGGDENDAIEDSDHGFAGGRGQVGVGRIGIDEDGCDAMIAAEAALDVENFTGLELHVASEIGVVEPDENVCWYRRCVDRYMNIGVGG